MTNRGEVNSKCQSHDNVRMCQKTLNWNTILYEPLIICLGITCKKLKPFRGDSVTFLYCRSFWTHIDLTLHGHPHRSLVAQQQFSSSPGAKKLHNYSSSQKRIWGVQHIASFSKLFPTTKMCVWVNEKEGKPQLFHFHPYWKVKHCESMLVHTDLHWK